MSYISSEKTKKGSEGKKKGSCIIHSKFTQICKTYYDNITSNKCFKYFTIPPKLSCEMTRLLLLQRAE